MAIVDNTRLMVLETLLEVEKKNIFVKEALHKLLFQKQFLSKQERSFITRMVEGITEYQVKLDYVIDCFSNKKVNKCKPLIRVVLRMGAYQILFMDSIPDEAACDECVKLTKKKGFHNLSGFVNGVLRNIVRNKESIHYPKKEDNLLLYYSVTYSMPIWIVEKMIAWYGEKQTEQMLKASVQPAKLTVRINTNKTTKEECIKKIQEKDIVVEEAKYIDNALYLDHINYVKRVPGFKEGDFFVQDESSMLLFGASGIDPTKETTYKILDLCAAPGGKCTQFGQELGDKAQIEARDVSDKKVALIRENVERLGIDNIVTKVWDALVFDPDKEEWADIVIADLPCSGLGIIGKKNDIKYHVGENQLRDLANLQRTILANASRYVKPGGILLFSTCTINPEENIENAKWFLEHFDFEPDRLGFGIPKMLQEAVNQEYMLQLLPGVHDCDGFFIAKFRKK
ncbi:MAG: 16S rRNA (cytosine(967)-C(5))-methyltransferase RsmB [Eubacteriales bacterium]|nr:16S rRNA (cytosine(967)-C(5))-methyltransferase RsmB [Eubacteriales bacterium]